MTHSKSHKKLLKKKKDYFKSIKYRPRIPVILPVMYDNAGNIIYPPINTDEKP